MEKSHKRNAANQDLFFCSFKTLRVLQLQNFSEKRLKVHLLVPNSFGVENNTINHLRHGGTIQSVLTYCCAIDLGTFSSICWHCVIATVIQSLFVVKKKKHRHCVGPSMGSAVVFCAYSFVGNHLILLPYTMQEALLYCSWPLSIIITSQNCRFMCSCAYMANKTKIADS